MRYLGLLSITLISASLANADLLKLKNGKSLAGAIVSMDTSEVRIERCSRTEIYPRADVETISIEPLPEDCTIPPPVRKLDLPGGAKIRVKLLDFIDSTHEPPGKTFRATVLQPVVAGGTTVIRKGAGFIVRLIPDGDGGQTLDLAGVNVGVKEWASFQGLSLKAMLSVIGDATDARQEAGNEPLLEPILLQGQRVFIPSLTAVTFTMKTPVRLVIAPPMR